MTNEDLTHITTSAREINPKAVFLGSVERIINPLALYLTERSVDLYAGRRLDDAFYGDYFFFIGDAVAVKNFIALYGSRLPRSLFIFVGVSDYSHWLTAVAAESNIKTLLLEEAFIPTGAIEQVMEFFFTSDRVLLDLRENLPQKIGSQAHVVQRSLSTPEVSPLTFNPRVYFEPKPINAASPTESPNMSAVREEKAPEIPQEVHSRFTADFVPPRNEASAVHKNIQSLFSAPPKPTGKRRHFPNLAIAAFAVLVVVVVIPLIGLMGASVFAAAYFKLGERSLVREAYGESASDFKKARDVSVFLRQNIVFFAGLFDTIGARSTFSSLEQVAQIGEHAAASGVYLAQAAEDGKSLLESVLGETKSGSAVELSSTIRGQLALAETEMAVVQAELKTQEFQRLDELPLLGRFIPNYELLEERIQTAREGITSARSALSILPELIGIYGARTYLVLFQNNMELRPTGGFIGSFGLLSFEGGKLKEFSVEDVYTADGALKGHVDPPEALKVHLAQEHWYLRDSNWDPDFKETAARALWFLDKELGISVQGVFAIDLAVVEGILKTTGPITLADFSEPVSAENLFKTAHTHIQTDFFPGSTKKSDFLGALGRQLLSESLYDTKVSKTHLLMSLFMNFNQKHALAFSTIPQMQGVFHELGWSGEFRVPSCIEISCFADFVYVVDANVGVNKSNYYVSREVSDQVLITNSGTLTHRLTISYHNAAPSEADPIGGRYKNYLRVYLPVSARPLQVMQQGIALSLMESGVASNSAAVVAHEARGTVVETLVEVPANAQGQVVVAYTIDQLPANLSQYRLSFLKQPGTAADTHSVVVTYPSGWYGSLNGGSGAVAGASTLVNAGEITYNKPLLTDQHIEIDFTR